MPDNSTDIESDNVIKRYQRRSKKLEQLCLGHFVARFKCVKDKHAGDNTKSNKLEETSDHFLPETDFDDNVDDDPSDQNN